MRQPHLYGDVVDINELHWGPDAPVHLQRRPECAPHLGSTSSRIFALQEAHDDEEQQQEGRREEEAVQQQPLDPCPGHVGRDPVLHEEVEEVAQRPCEEEPEAAGRGGLDHLLGLGSPPNARSQTLPLSAWTTQTRGPGKCAFFESASSVPVCF